MHIKNNIDAALKAVPLADVTAWQNSPVTDALFVLLIRAQHSRAGASADYELGRIAGLQEALEAIRTFDVLVEEATKDKAFAPSPSYAKPGSF